MNVNWWVNFMLGEMHCANIFWGLAPDLIGGLIEPRKLPNWFSHLLLSFDFSPGASNFLISITRSVCQSTELKGNARLKKKQRETMAGNLCDNHTKLNGTVPLNNWRKSTAVHTWRKCCKKRVAFQTIRMKRVSTERVRDICVTFSQRKVGQLRIETEGERGCVTI